MNKFTEIINEAALNANKLKFIPVDMGKDSKVGKYGIAVGNTFNIKKTQYCQNVEKKLQEIGVSISTGIDKAKDVVSKTSVKLIYVMYTQGDNTFAMIVNASMLTPLDKTQKIK